jgi:hypothetical protein
MLVGNGKRTDFLEDTRCGVVALKDKFRELFDMTKKECGRDDTERVEDELS